MLTIEELTRVIENYNHNDAGSVRIDVRVAGHIVRALQNSRPSTRGEGAKIPLPAPGTGIKILKSPHLLNTAYIFRDSGYELWILIKGGTKISRGTASQPGQIGEGSRKMIKIFGGILIELNIIGDILGTWPVVTISSISRNAKKPGDLKQEAFEREIRDAPNDFLYTFWGIRFRDPNPDLRKHGEMRTILYQPYYGKCYQDVREDWSRRHYCPPWEHMAHAVFSYLDQIKNILASSLWPIDLKPENTAYAEKAGEPPVVTIFDFIGAGSTWTPFKNQFDLIRSFVERLFKRPISAIELPQAVFYGLVYQLMFEIAHMIFLICNPSIDFIPDAGYDGSFNAEDPNRIEVIRFEGTEIVISLHDYPFGAFFATFCRNKNFLGTFANPSMPAPDFKQFLLTIRELLRGIGRPEAQTAVDIIPPGFSSEWIDKFDALIRNFLSLPAPVPHEIPNIVMVAG